MRRCAPGGKGAERRTCFVPADHVGNAAQRHSQRGGSAGPPRQGPWRRCGRAGRVPAGTGCGARSSARPPGGGPPTSPSGRLFLRPVTSLRSPYCLAGRSNRRSRRRGENPPSGSAGGQPYEMVESRLDPKFPPELRAAGGAGWPSRAGSSTSCSTEGRQSSSTGALADFFRHEASGWKVDGYLHRAAGRSWWASTRRWRATRPAGSARSGLPRAGRRRSPRT